MSGPRLTPGAHLDDGVATQPSPVLPRVLEAMTAPQRSHLDSDMIALLDDIRRRLHGLFNVSDEGIAFAVSGTGSSGLEAAVANVVREGDAVLAVVTGYFGDRLAQVASGTAPT